MSHGRHQWHTRGWCLGDALNVWHHENVSHIKLWQSPEHTFTDRLLTLQCLKRFVVRVKNSLEYNAWWHVAYITNLFPSNLKNKSKSNETVSKDWTRWSAPENLKQYDLISNNVSFSSEVSVSLHSVPEHRSVRIHLAPSVSFLPPRG